MLQWKIFRNPLVAILWFVFITILFFLPGSSLPKETWFTKVQIDKWAHVGLFAVLLFLCCGAFSNGKSRRVMLMLVVAVIYGLLVEFIQKNFIPNRDFDLLDLACDTIGAMLGITVWRSANKETGRRGI